MRLDVYTASERPIATNTACNVGPQRAHSSPSSRTAAHLFRRLRTSFGPLAVSTHWMQGPGGSLSASTMDPDARDTAVMCPHTPCNAPGIMSRRHASSGGQLAVVFDSKLAPRQMLVRALLRPADTHSIVIVSHRLVWRRPQCAQSIIREVSGQYSALFKAIVRLLSGPRLCRESPLSLWLGAWRTQKLQLAGASSWVPGWST